MAIPRNLANFAPKLDSSGNPTFTAPTVFSAGTASLPSITFTGDTNTGIFSPGADTIAFTEGGVEAMRIDSSGNVGIGTSSPGPKLHLYGDTVDAVQQYIENNNAAGSSAEKRLTLSMGGSSAFGITAWQNAGIVEATSSGGLYLGAYNGAIKFATGVQSRSEVGRFTSGGEFYVAGTTDQGAYNIQCNGTGVWGAGAYVNGSDARIKEDVAPIDSGLDVVTKLNPVTYRYKEDWSKDQNTQTGFIAQELLVALEGKNYVDGVVQQGGSEGYYSVAYQNIIPILTKAIQELSVKNDALEARLAALEAK